MVIYGLIPDLTREPDRQIPQIKICLFTLEHIHNMDTARYGLISLGPDV